jgi:hypothetical protein
MKLLSLHAKRARLARWTTGFGIALLVYALVGFFLLPGIIQRQMLKRLPAITQRAVAVQQVRVNPFALLLTIRGFSLKEPNGDVFCSFEEMRANLRLVSIFQRAFVFQEIRFKKPFGNLIFQKDGDRNFSNLWNASPTEATLETWQPKSPRVVVKRLSIEEGTLFFDDLNRKSRLKFSQIALTLERHSNQTNAPISTTLSMICNGMGKIALQGTVLPSARSADVQVQVTDLDLRAIQPYVAEIWKLEITGGALTAKGRVLVAATGHRAPLVQFSGDLGVARFTSVDAGASEEFLKLDSLMLSGLDLRYQPHGLDVVAVNLVGLRGNMIIRPDKTSNWKGMLKNAEKLHELIVKLQLDKLFPFQIGMVSFENGSFGFADRSIEPNVVAEIQEVAGSVTGLSSTTQAIASVDLQGKVDDHSTLAVTGTINPLADDLKIDLALSLKNGGMTPASPYATKYVGYPIQRGVLSIEAHYAINQRALKAENKISMQQLRLGAKSNSPDATQLRIKLAIALLQDRDGVLTLDLPVSGNLDDPQFRLNPIITQIFVNLITKAVSNPFALLGSLLGETEGLSYIAFEPGRSEFTQGEAKKVDTLATALHERPSLELQIVGSVDPVKDREALARFKLEQQLTLHSIKELTAGGNAPASIEAFQLAPTDHERLVMLAYGEATGTFVAKVAALRVAQIPLSKEQTDWEQMSTKDNAMFPILYRVTPLLVVKAGQLNPTEKYSNDLTLAGMEAKLIERIEVTDNDFQTLMRERADKVHNALVQTGKVTAERLFILAPKPADPSHPGQSRVDLSLQ